MFGRAPRLRAGQPGPLDGSVQAEAERRSGTEERLRELAGERRRFGYRRLHVMLKREGQMVNHKRVYRLYREEGLAVRKRKRKRVSRPRDSPFRSRPGRTRSGAWTSSATPSPRAGRSARSTSKTLSIGSPWPSR